MKSRLLLKATPTLTYSQFLVSGTYGFSAKRIQFEHNANPLSEDNYFVWLSFCTGLSQTCRLSESGKVPAQCQVQRSFLFFLKQKGFKCVFPSWQQWQMGLYVNWIPDGLFEPQTAPCKWGATNPVWFVLFSCVLFFVSVCCTFLISEILKGFFYIFANFFRTVTSSPPLPFSCIVSIGVLWEPWLGETKGEARARKTRRPPNRSQILCLQNGLPVTVSALAVGWGMDKQTSELLLQTNQMINNLGFVDNGISGINLNSAFLIVIHP